MVLQHRRRCLRLPDTRSLWTGAILKLRLRLVGQSSYAEGSASILLSMDGTFEWSRRTGKKVSAYVATRDSSVRSNTVTIR